MIFNGNQIEDIVAIAPLPPIYWIMLGLQYKSYLVHTTNIQTAKG